MSAARLPADGAFDLILADPPYAAGSGDAALAAIVAAYWGLPGGWLAIETERGQAIAAAGPWAVEAERDVGRARITLLRRA